MKENGKIKKICDSEEEMKDNQPKKSSVKIEELNVVTHDIDSEYNILHMLYWHILMVICTVGFSIQVLLF